jgi:hypothetical protein
MCRQHLHGGQVNDRELIVFFSRDEGQSLSRVKGNTVWTFDSNRSSGHVRFAARCVRVGTGIQQNAMTICLDQRRKSPLAQPRCAPHPVNVS